MGNGRGGRKKICGGFCINHVKTLAKSGGKWYYIKARER